MQISSSAYTSANVSETRKNILDKMGQAAVTDIFKDSVSAQAQAPVSGAVTGMTTSHIADDTIGAVVRQSQETNTVYSGDTSQFEKLNFMSKSDRKLLEAMTGYSVGEFGQFTDKNGKPGYPEDLTQHSLRSFEITMMGERKNGGIAGEDISVSEFKQFMAQARASATSMGETFNEDLLIKGLAHIRART